MVLLIVTHLYLFLIHLCDRHHYLNLTTTEKKSVLLIHINDLFFKPFSLLMKLMVDRQRSIDARVP